MMRWHCPLLFGSLAAVALYLESMDFFIYSASFLHYFRFVDQFYYRRKESHQDFIEDAMIYKAVS